MTAWDDDINRTVGAPPLDRVESDESELGALDANRRAPDTERLWMQEPSWRGGSAIEDDAGEPHEAIPSVAQVAGHPLHPSVVPLPIGAFVGAFLSDVAYATTHDRFWARASRTLLGAGVVTGLLAGSLGAMDFLGRDRIRDHGSAWIHAGGNLAALLIASLSLGARRREGEAAIVPGGLVATTMIALTLGVTGWLGGELAYRHRIGVTEEG